MVGERLAVTGDRRLDIAADDADRSGRAQRRRDGWAIGMLDRQLAPEQRFGDAREKSFRPFDDMAAAYSKDGGKAEKKRTSMPTDPQGRGRPIPPTFAPDSMRFGEVAVRWDQPRVSPGFHCRHATSRPGRASCYLVAASP